MWVLQLFIAQIVFGYISVAVVHLVWKLLNPGAKIW